MNCICPHCKNEIPASHFTGQIGKIKTEAKRLASISNGKKGGRPPYKKQINSKGYSVVISTTYKQS